MNHMKIQEHQFYSRLMTEGHILVAGATGSGKSVVLNGLIMQAIGKGYSMMLLDPKGGAEFSIYRDTVNCCGYGADVEQFPAVLQEAVQIMDKRYETMTAKHLRKSEEDPLYVIIDEYGDMMSDCKKVCQPPLLKLARKGRAANVRLILATQSPYKSIITGDIKANMQATVALRTRAKSDSRLIIDEAGAETLNIGEALVLHKGAFSPVKERVPMYSEDFLEQVALFRTPPSKRWK